MTTKAYLTILQIQLLFYYYGCIVSIIRNITGIYSFPMLHARALHLRNGAKLLRNCARFSSSSDNEDKGGVNDDLFDKFDFQSVLSNSRKNAEAKKDNSLTDQIRSQYDDVTIQALLDTHALLNEEIKSMEKEENFDQSRDGKSIQMQASRFSLHDLVLQTISGEESSVSKISTIPDSLREKAFGIRAIATDVDGTLMNGQQYVHPRTMAALRRAIEEVSIARKMKNGDETPVLLKSFFLATGKSRKGALDSLGPEITELVNTHKIPGVYIQGLYCVDGCGNVIFEKKLALESVAAAEELAKSTDVAIVSYDGDYLFTTDLREEVVQLSVQYGEPMPNLLPHNAPLTSYTNGIHKILLMDNDINKLNQVRPCLEQLAKEYDATVTQAIPTMLEFLPGGCSKGKGVAELCNALNINASTELLALGDAENDVGMLELAAIGCAVGNASPPARNAADHIMDECNDDGGAGAAMELFVFERVCQ